MSLLLLPTLPGRRVVDEDEGYRLFALRSLFGFGREIWIGHLVSGLQKPFVPDSLELHRRSLARVAVFTFFFGH